MASDPLSSIRLGLQTAIRKTLVGDQPPVRDLSKPVSGDTGLFGPESVTWRVHADSAMLIGGIRALLLQTMHPLAMAGVADHSAYRTDPTGRLWRTASFVGTTTFGTMAEAKQAVKIVKKVHLRVVGQAPDGRPYEANDPHLMAWVHHTLVESFLVSYQRYGSTKLSDDDADRYVAEQARLGDLMGVESPARSVAELHEAMSAIRSELKAGAQARHAIRFLLVPPLDLVARGPYALLCAAAVGLLPGWVRWDLRIPYLPITERVAVRPATKALSAILGWAMSAPSAPSARSAQSSASSRPSPATASQ
jgi:uncharacterized protein (DUF2236 family)